MLRQLEVAPKLQVRSAVGSVHKLEPPQDDDLATSEPRLASGGLVSAITAETFPFYKKLYSRKTLRTAWRVVYSNGVSSEKEETRRLVKEFSFGIETHLERIYNPAVTQGQISIPTCRRTTHTTERQETTPFS